MILLCALGLAIVLGLLRGGKLVQLASLPFHWPAVPLIAFALQLLVIYLPKPPGPEIAWPLVLLGISALALLATVYVNRRLPGMAVLGLGLLLNLAVMLANGGYMPITPQAVERIGHTSRMVTGATGTRMASSKDVMLAAEETRLYFLSDILVLARPFPIPSAFSLGDVAVALGAFILVQHALTPGDRTARRHLGDRNPLSEVEAKLRPELCPGPPCRSEASGEASLRPQREATGGLPPPPGATSPGNGAERYGQ